MMIKNFAILALFVVSLASCVPSPYFQKSVALPNNMWSQKFSPAFTFDVNDTNIFYNLDFIIRHTNNYAYSNIWLNVLVKEPGDSTFKSARIEIPLAEPNGKWLGQGMGELYEQRRMIVIDHNAIPITDNLIAISESSVPNLFRKIGKYEIRLQQNMRDEVLSDVLHVGLRVTKSSARGQKSQP